MLAWSFWLASMGCCAGGLLAALLWVRPLTPSLLAGGAATALTFPVGYATIGLVLSLRRPTNPIGWLYAASGLAWALGEPFRPWLDQLVRDHWPLPPAAQLAAVAGGSCGHPGWRSVSPCRSCSSPAGGCAHGAGGWWWPPP